MNGTVQLTTTHYLTVTQADIDAFNTAAGLDNTGSVGRGLFVAALTTRIIHKYVLRPDDVYLSQSLKCHHVVRAGDRLKVCTRLQKQGPNRSTLFVEVTNQHNKVVLAKGAVIQKQMADAATQTLNEVMAQATPA